MPEYSVLTAQGDLIVGGATGVETRLPGNTTTTRKFLLSVGDGANSSAPSWDQILIDDVDGLLTALDGKAPSSHTHAQSEITDLVSTLELKADLVGGKLVTSQIPAVAISEFLGAVDDEDEMLELVGQRGDYCYRNDVQAAFWLTDDDPSAPENWLQVAIPSVSVQSVNGQTGVVVLGYSDVGAAAATHSHAISDITNLQTSLDSKADLSGANFSGNVTVSGAQLRAAHSSGATFAIETPSEGFTNMQRTTSSGQSVISFDPIPSDGTSLSEFRFFRNVNTTGNVELTLYRGNGTTSVQHKIRSKGGPTYFCLIDGDFGVGTNTPQAKFHSIGSTIVGIATSAVSDENIGNGQVNIWIDEASNKLMFKCKTSGGTIKTGEIAIA
jgi:hypothetical protein